jgi:hypothetical protein
MTVTRRGSREGGAYSATHGRDRGLTNNNPPRPPGAAHTLPFLPSFLPPLPPLVLSRIGSSLSLSLSFIGLYTHFFFRLGHTHKGKGGRDPSPARHCHQQKATTAATDVLGPPFLPSPPTATLKPSRAHTPLRRRLVMVEGQARKQGSERVAASLTLTSCPWPWRRATCGCAG